MASNDITKDMLASGLKMLLGSMPLSRISVQDITSYCNVSRNTFYYHFRDKYDLVNWAFSEDMLKNVNTFSDPSKLTESFVAVCQCMYEKRTFYLACFQYVGQNSLYEHLFRFYCEMWKINLDMAYQEFGFKLSEEELDVMSKMKAHALVGIISDWVNDGMRDNYMTYFEKVRNILDSETSSYSFLSNQRMIESWREKYNSDAPKTFFKKDNVKVC